MQRIDERINSMKDPRIDKLARSIVNYSCKVQPGENVIIESHGDQQDAFVKALIREISAAGGRPFLWMYKMDVRREILLHSSPEQLEIAAEADALLMSKMHVYIRVRGEENNCELGDVPADKMGDFARIYSRRVNAAKRGKKFCVMHYPTLAMAQAERMSMEELENRFFEICTMDYDRMRAAYRPLKELMDRTDRVRITAKDTDLSFSIKGIRSVICAGENNIPDGECFTAPVRDSINGVITYNTTAYYDGVAFDHIRFRFRNGKIEEATSSDTEKLNRILDRDEGCRYIGEFAIGVNPYITRPWNDSMFNEKMTGSIHFTPGNSIDEASNGNKASIHWDIVLAQTPEFGGGEIWFDDVLVRKDGRFVLPELEGLNPENLL